MKEIWLQNCKKWIGGGGIKGELHLNTFQAIQKPYHHIVNLCCGVFCEFLGDFWVYLGVVFLERLVKLREIRNIEDLVKF